MHENVLSPVATVQFVSDVRDRTTQVPFFSDEEHVVTDAGHNVNRMEKLH